MADTKVKKIPIPVYTCISCGERGLERFGRIRVDHTHGCLLQSWIRTAYPRLAARIDNQRQRDLDELAQKVGLHHDKRAA